MSDAGIPGAARSARPMTTLETLISRLYREAWAGAAPGRRLGLLTLVSTPEGADQLLRDPDAFAKKYDLLDRVARSRFSAVGTDWAARRESTQPTLRAAAVRAQVGRMEAAYEARIGALAPGPGDGLDAAFVRAGTEILAGAFGAALPPEALADWTLAMRATTDRIMQTSLFGAAPQEMALMGADAMAMRARAEGEFAGEMGLKVALHRMERAFADHGGTKPFDPLSEWLVTLMAGTETTGATLIWAALMLGRHPEAQERIGALVRRALEEGPQGGSGAGPVAERVRRQAPRGGAGLGGQIALVERGMHWRAAAHGEHGAEGGAARVGRARGRGGRIGTGVGTRRRLAARRTGAVVWGSGHGGPI